MMQDLNVKFEMVQSPELPRNLIGDMDRIQQVILNLLANARKFVRKTSGIICIETSFIPEPDNFLQISIGNNGNPISLEAQQQLFKPFSKLMD